MWAKGEPHMCTFHTEQVSLGLSSSKEFVYQYPAFDPFCVHLTISPASKGAQWRPISPGTHPTTSTCLQPQQACRAPPLPPWQGGFEILGCFPDSSEIWSKLSAEGRHPLKRKLPPVHVLTSNNALMEYLSICPTILSRSPLVPFSCPVGANQKSAQSLWVTDRLWSRSILPMHPTSSSWSNVQLDSMETVPWYSWHLKSLPGRLITV